MNTNDEELTVGEIISRSWQEIKGRFAPFMVLACITPAFGWLAAVLAFGLNPLTQNASQQQHPFLGLFVTVLTALLGCWTMAAFILFVCKRADTPVDALLTAWGRPFLRLLGGGLLYSFAAMLLFVCCMFLFMFGGAWYTADNTFISSVVFILLSLLVMVLLVGVFVYFCLLPYFLILTDISVFSCFRLAFGLVWGKFWQTFGLILLLMLISLAINMLGGIVLVILTFILSLALPSLAGLFSLLWIPVTGLTTLALQVPLLALYLDRSHQNQAPQEQTE